MRIALLLLAMFPVLRAQSDVVMNAMRDEMARSMKELAVENLDKPYFISYRVVDSESTSVSASFGALNHSNTGRSRRLIVDVRVGDYKLDNSHFFSIDFDMGARMQIFNGTTSLPLEDDYKEIRRQLWLATDATYKKAVEDFSKKRAYLENRSREDDSADFSRESPLVSAFDAPAPKIDIPKWETEAREISALFRQMPAIQTSTITFNYFGSYARFLTSEGTSYTRRQSHVVFNGDAATQAPDGAPLDDFVWFHGRSPAELPSQQELITRMQQLGHYLSDLRDAPTLVNYNGPVLVEGDAAAQFVRLVFVPSLLAGKRTQTSMPGMQQQNNQGENPFLDKIGARVMPEFLSLTDNPAIDTVDGHRLEGISKFDEDGVNSREVKLVENGILRTLLASRDPVRGIDHSTGSRHAGQATPSNIIVNASNGLAAADLRAKFIDMIGQRKLAFGIVVRRMRNVNNAILAYKVFPDGHEELVRNMQFFGLNAASFKDIVAASREPNFLTVRFQPQQSGPMFMPNEGEENFTPVSLVVPSLLFDDLTMRKVRAPAPTPPIATHPFFDK